MQAEAVSRPRRRALILAAGRLGDPERIRRLVAPRPEDLVICADGGAAHALSLGWRPHLVVGDFDSLPPGLMERLQAEGVPLRRVPRDKDETDLHLAVAEAVGQGAEELVLLGAVGTRLDHTLAALLMLPGFAEGRSVTVVDERNVLRILPPGGAAELTGRPGDVVSLLPLSPAVTGIRVEGLRWDPRGRLTWGESRGVSNELIAPRARVCTGSGWLLIVQVWE